MNDHDWRLINREDDAPNHDCFVAFIEHDYNHGGNIDCANVGGSVGYLSWSKNSDWYGWTIIEDGEIITPHQVWMLAKISPPLGLIR